MRLRTPILAVAGLFSIVQAHEFEPRHARRGLSEVLAELGALEGLKVAHQGKGSKGKGQGQSIASTVTVKSVATAPAAVVAGNGTCPNTATVTAARAALPPVVSASPLAHGSTQIITISITAGGGGAGVASGAVGGVSRATAASSSRFSNVVLSSGAGIKPPGAVGTGAVGSGVSVTAARPSQSIAAGISMPGAVGTNPLPAGVNSATLTSAVIVQTGSPGIAASQQAPGAASAPTQASAAAQPPPVGSPGAMALGTGTLVNGACSCSCLCGPGSFPNMGSMVAPPAPAVASTLATVRSSDIPANSAASPVFAPTISTSNVPAPSTSGPASDVLLSVPTLSSTPTQAQAQPIESALATASSQIELSVTATAQAVSTPLGAAAQVAPSQSDPINISAFTLKSSLVLGSLAQATPNPQK